MIVSRRRFGNFLAASTAMGIALKAKAQTMLPFSSLAVQNGTIPIPSDRLAQTNWQNAGLLSIGGIPTGTIFNPGGLAGNGVGGADQSSAIQTLLNNAGAAAGPGNIQIVLLQGSASNTGVGGFHCNSYLSIPSYVVLMGQGPNLTEMHKSNGSGARSGTTQSGTNGIKAPGSATVTNVEPFIYIGSVNDPYMGQGNIPPWFQDADTVSVNLTADGTQGATSVTVASVTGLSVGMIVLLDERANAGWIASSGGIGATTPVWANDRTLFPAHWPNGTGNSTWSTPPIFVDDQNTGADSTRPYDSTASGGAGSGSLPDFMCYFDRWVGTRGSNVTDVMPTSECKEIVAIDSVNKIVTFSSPITITYRVSHTAQLTTYPAASTFGNYAQVWYAGVQGIKFTNGGEGSIKIHGAYCWVDNCEMTLWGGDTNGDCISLNGCFRCQITGCYVHTCTYPYPANGAYCICLAYGTADCLVQNNICLDANKLIQTKGCGAGSVMGYNYCDDGWDGSSPPFVETQLDSTHNAGAHHQLWEGNCAPNLAMDCEFGSASYITWFRNWGTGWRRDFNDQVGQGVVELCYGSWYHSFVGNVFGAPSRPSWIWSSGGFSGTTTGAGWDITAPAMQCNSSGGSCSAMSTNWTDENIYKVGFWNNSNPYPDPLAISSLWRDGNYDYVTNSQIWNNTPATFPIPNSLYLPGKPSFFLSTDQWPWADPANPSGTVGGGNPALRRYNAGTPNVIP